jgi:hypothetical protein
MAENADIDHSKSAFVSRQRNLLTFTILELNQQWNADESSSASFLHWEQHDLILMRDLEFKITISQTLAFPYSPPTYLPSVTNHIASYSTRPAFPSLYFFLPFPLDSTQQLRLVSGAITITLFPFHPRPTSLISPIHPPLPHHYLSPPSKT